MSRDPNERFVINAITRAQIAADLNEHIANTTGSEAEHVKPNDARLTLKICQNYADALANIDEDMSETQREEACANACHQTLQAIGIEIDPNFQPNLD